MDMRVWEFEQMNWDLYRDSGRHSGNTFVVHAGNGRGILHLFPVKGAKIANIKHSQA